jgi:diguanylate cyclase (GGDEF)-like protein
VVTTALLVLGGWGSVTQYRSTAATTPVTTSLTAVGVGPGGVFDQTVLVPGIAQTRCVGVSLRAGGSAETADIAVSVVDVTGPLAGQLSVSVDQVSGASCTASPPRRLFTGTLSELAARGGDASLSTAAVLTGGATDVSYLLTASIDDTAPQGGTAQGRFVWSATSTASEPEIVATPAPTPTAAPTDAPTATVPEIPTAAVPDVPGGVGAPTAAPSTSTDRPRETSSPTVPAPRTATARPTGAPAATAAAPGSGARRTPPTATATAGLTGAAGPAASTTPVSPATAAAPPSTSSPTPTSPTTSTTPQTTATGSGSASRPAGARPGLLDRARTAWGAHVDALTGALPPRLVTTALGVADHGGFPLLLLAVVVLFLLLQDHVDRRDPKLAAAPLRPDEPLDFDDLRGAAVQHPSADSTSRTGTTGLLSLQDRLRWITALRLLVALAPVLLAALGGSLSPTGPLADGALLVPALVQCATIVVMPLLHRAPRRTAVAALGSAMLLDGAYLAWAFRCLDGLDGLVPPLVLLHVLAVTLLASFRTGVKIAVWQVLVALVVVEADAAGLLGQRLLVVDPERFALAGTVLLLLTLTTATFAAVNERELRRRRADALTLHALALALEDCEEPVAAAGLLTDLGSTELSARRAVVVLLHPGPGAQLRPEAVALRPAAATPTESRGRGGAGAVLTRALEERRPALLSHLDPADDPWLCEVLPGARDVVVVPFGHNGGLRGALVLEGAGSGVVAGRHHPRRHRMDRRLLALAEQATAHAGQAMARTRLVTQLREAADTDGLTGLRNRRALDAVLAVELAATAHPATTCAVLLLDLDHFKALNDTHGHQAGDDALRAVGRLLATAVRAGTTAARYGGEEFCVVAPGLTVEEALELGERLRADIAADRSTATPLTVSIGVAIAPTVGTDAATVLAAADAALYRAKEAGRDRVVAAAPAVPSPMGS